MQTRFLTWFGKPIFTPQVPTVLEYCALLLIQVKDIIFLMNPHQAISSLEDVNFQDFFLDDNTSPIAKSLSKMLSVHNYDLFYNKMHFLKESIIQIKTIIFIAHSRALKMIESV